MANFGRSMLEKYGWTDGKGLGREETGIAKAIKVSGNFNSYGLGHDVGKEFKNQWWDHVYNKTADNIIVGKAQDGSVQLTRKNEALAGQKVLKPYAKASSTQYSSFVKEGVLKEEEEEKDMSLQLSYDELFKICGGRTAHKGARHGIKMSAKLARVEKQEQDLLKKWEDDKGKLSQESPPVNENPERPKKKSKKKKKEDFYSCDNVSLHECRDKEDFQCVESDHLSKKDRKDKKKKKKLHCVENEISCEESLPLDEGSFVDEICPPVDPDVEDREVIKKPKKKKKKSTKDEKENTVETAMATSESEIVEKKKKHKKRKKEKEESENLMCEDLTDSQQCKDSNEMEINVHNNECHKKKKKKHKNLL